MTPSPSRAPCGSDKPLDRSRCGAALLLTFFLMLVLSGIALAISIFSHNSLLTGRSQMLDRQAFYVAEAGLQRARQQLVAKNWLAAASPGNTYTEGFPSRSGSATGGDVGEYSVTVVSSAGCPSSCTYTVTSSGYVPNTASYLARRQAVANGMSVTVSNGSNLSLGASVSASASGSQGSDVPGNARDDNTNSQWRANTQGSGSWLEFDFGSTTSLDKMVVLEGTTGGVEIDGMTIAGSSDNSSWTTLPALSITESPTSTWTATFTRSSYRYYRVTFTSVPSNQRAGVTEWQGYDSTITLNDEGHFTTQW